MYETFLSTVPILASLEGYERAKIADALESRTFNVGENVITEGEVGEDFFLVESGTAEAIKGGNVVLNYKKGDYFGGASSLFGDSRLTQNRVGSAEPSKPCCYGPCLGRAWFEASCCRAWRASVHPPARSR